MFFLHLRDKIFFLPATLNSIEILDGCLISR